MRYALALIFVAVAISAKAQDAAEPAVNLPTGPAEQISPLPIPSVTPALPELSTLDQALDRKSTRLNSSHANISYAVFCLKKKKTNNSP